MYERMLDPIANPDYDALASWCGAGEARFRALNALLAEAGTAQTIRLPYGKRYGWGVKHSVKARHICDVFAERGACNLMLRMSDAQYAQAYSSVSEATRAIIDGKYPCGDGGWIHLRVADDDALADAERLLRVKLGKA